MELVVGVDPGLDGAIVGIEVETRKALFVFVMPTYDIKKGTKKKPKTKRMYDEAKIRDAIKIIFTDFYSVFCIIEKTQPMPKGKNAQASHGLGFCEGIFKGIFLQAGKVYETVRPMEWQKHFGITKAKGDKKKQSYATASQLFPDVELVTPRGRILDGKADALLIAEFGIRKLFGKT